jgi:hypothetical protein
MTEAYPLQWPPHKPRTKRRERSRFDTRFAVARDGVFEQIRMLGGQYAVISTNITLRRDGLPYANQPEPDDPGVAVYFEMKGENKCFSCDRWDRVKDNLRAVEKTIEAMRGIARWGSGDMVDAAFAGFQALPPPWWLVLGLDARPNDRSAARTAWRNSMKKAHPDNGGSTDRVARVNEAYEQAKRELS